MGNNDIPGTSKPATCRQIVDDHKCGKVAHHTISGKVEVFGKILNVKFAVCDDHFRMVNENVGEGYSIDH